MKLVVMLANLLIVLHIAKMTAVNSAQNVEKALGETKRL
jgi:hypothetical protein